LANPNIVYIGKKISEGANFEPCRLKNSPSLFIKTALSANENKLTKRTQEWGLKIEAGGTLPKVGEVTQTHELSTGPFLTSPLGANFDPKVKQ
jgi:hypothetical protein